nr:hypothetical protein Iba_chr01cCG5960 [Ipomoea batatas]
MTESSLSWTGICIDSLAPLALSFSKGLVVPLGSLPSGKGLELPSKESPTGQPSEDILVGRSNRFTLAGSSRYTRSPVKKPAIAPASMRSFSLKVTCGCEGLSPYGQLSEHPDHPQKLIPRKETANFNTESKFEV